VESGERLGGGVQVGVAGMDWLSGWEERRLGSFLKYLIKQTGNYPNAGGSDRI
jgi:hypothetical protein